MSIVFFTTDLMFPSRLSAVASRCGWELRVMSNVEAVVQSCASTAPDLLILDLDMPGMDAADVVSRLQEVPFPPRAIVAYGPHVDEATLAAAANAGCDEVLARGQFHRDMEGVVRRYL